MQKKFVFKHFSQVPAQKGQVLIFYALMLPLLFLFVGVVGDFGWLYFNQSRLQNAADAAVVAGARELIEKDQALSDYTYTTFVANSEEGFLKLVKDNIVISKRSTAVGDEVAQTYVIKNLSNNGSMVDSWNGNAEVNFSSKLYGSDEKDHEALYYTVTLSEKVNHIFGIMNTFGFGDLKTKATAVAKISYVAARVPTYIENDTVEYVHGPSLYEQMKAKEELETYPNWDYIADYYSDPIRLKNFPAKVANKNKAADARSVLTAGINYDQNNANIRTETSTLHGIGFQGNYAGHLVELPTVNQFLLDDLFVDFRADITFHFSSDWDLGYQIPGALQYKWNYGDSAPNDEHYTYRVHSMINVDKIYPVRKDKDAPDPLFIRIESEPVNSEYYYSSTVRQLIINVNVANTDEDSDRPMLFFYEAPIKLSASSSVRNSLPVILNLNADFRGVLFAPQSPVVVNGNGHNFEGFVVGEKYLHLKTRNDYTEINYDNKTYYVESSDMRTWWVSDNDVSFLYKNAWYFVDKNNLYSEVTQEEKENTNTYRQVYPMIVDSKGNVQFTEEFSANVDLAEGAKPNDPDWKYGDDKTFFGNPFNLASTTYNSFLQVKLVDYTYLDGGSSADNMFTTARSKHID